MEKLIELLNEYEKLNMCRTFIGYYKQEEEITWLYFSIKACELISTKFWFIKWLVDNDKIDLENVKNIKLPIDTKLWARVDKDEKTCFNRLYTLKLLMLLSIQDNPIEFLVSVLK